MGAPHPVFLCLCSQPSNKQDGLIRIKPCYAMDCLSELETEFLGAFIRLAAAHGEETTGRALRKLRTMDGSAISYDLSLKAQCNEFYQPSRHAVLGRKLHISLLTHMLVTSGTAKNLVHLTTVDAGEALMPSCW